ncbi:MAG TPA: nucleotide disphospho-sugar-binding domain-containing protein [Propionibacteriaceae bacterium]|nr:nucleotide disphospho-sugar-binding domain-containing protein [Propionibacteriaceae bacterium]
MSRFLLPCTPIYGHVAPMLTIGAGLLARGHQVTVLTGRKYRSAVEQQRLSFVPLPAEVDYDDAHIDDWLPGHGRYTGIAAGRHDILGLFVRPLVAQARALADTLAAEDYHAVVADAAFLGALPMLLSVPTVDRIPVVGVSATPLSLTSIDCAPFGSGLDPGNSAHTRRRNRFIAAVLQHGPLRSIRAALDEALAEAGAPPAPGGYFDAAARFDLTFQLSVRGLEYPRREMPPTIRFVGPLTPDVGRQAKLPSWWGDLDGARPVVHVTQGTMANVDLGRLLVPTIAGLRDENLLVVAATGGRPVAELEARHGGPLPANVRVAEFLPYPKLLPLVDVMITNGGFGGVQQALSYGLPLVVAGSSEDKPEVAGRVAWSGAGLNLRTGAPSAARVRRAVRLVLRDPRFACAAAKLQAEIAAQPDPVTQVAQTLETLTSPPARPSAVHLHLTQKPASVYQGVVRPRGL